MITTTYFLVSKKKTRAQTPILEHNGTIKQKLWITTDLKFQFYFIDTLYYRIPSFPFIIIIVKIRIMCYIQFILIPFDKIVKKIHCHLITLVIICLNKQRKAYYRVGTLVNSAYWSYKGQGFSSSTSMRLLTNACNNNSGGHVFYCNFQGHCTHV